MPRALLLGAALLVAPAFLSSCVDLKASLEIARDGSARLGIRYAVSRMALSLDALSTALVASAGSSPATDSASAQAAAAPDPGFLPLPLTRAAFDEAAAAAPGTSILSWKQSETRDDLVIESELSFTGLPALAAFFESRGGRVRYSEAEGRRNLVLSLWPGLGGAEGLDPDLIRFVNAAFDSYRISLETKLPGAPLSSGIGTLGPGNTVTYLRPLADLVQSAAPVALELRW